MERTWKPTTAGVLTIITGAWGIFMGVIVMLASGILRAVSAGGLDIGQWLEQWSGGRWGLGSVDVSGMLGQILGGAAVWVMVAGIVVLVFGIIALCGGISALKRRRWGLSLAGGILSLPLIPAGPILGILAIVFVSLGKKEFE
jgi:hypothetical protein